MSGIRTITLLNKNTIAGGDAMDESQVDSPVPEAPGGKAKRPNVVVGGVDGSLVDTETSEGTVKLLTKANQGSPGVLPWPVVIASSDAIRTNVPSAITDTLLLDPNPGRRGAFIYNDSTSVLRVGLGTAPVTANDFSFLVAADTEWTIPFGYTGELRGIWDTAIGRALLTELT